MTLSSGSRPSQCQRGTSNAHVSSRIGWESKRLADALLEQAGVAALSGASFGKHGEGFLRFSVANSMENLMETLKRIDAWAQRNL
jgi:aspartate aminotransferase